MNDSVTEITIETTTVQEFTKVEKTLKDYNPHTFKTKNGYYHTVVELGLKEDEARRSIQAELEDANIFDDNIYSRKI